VFVLLTAPALATIRAVGRSGRTALVERSDIEWGMEIVQPAGDQLAVQARDRMVNDDQSFGKRVNRVKGMHRNYQRGNGGAAMPRTALLNATGYSWCCRR
jgi:hypothetical protein